MAREGDGGPGRWVPDPRGCAVPRSGATGGLGEAQQGSWAPTGALCLGFRVSGVAMVTQLPRNLLTSVLSDSHVW